MALSFLWNTQIPSDGKYLDNRDSAAENTRLKGPNKTLDAQTEMNYQRDHYENVKMFMYLQAGSANIAGHKQKFGKSRNHLVPLMLPVNISLA